MLRNNGGDLYLISGIKMKMSKEGCTNDERTNVMTMDKTISERIRASSWNIT